MAQKLNNPLGGQVPHIDTTTYGRGSASVTDRRGRRRTKRTRKTQAPSNGQTLLTRRALLFGALGVGAVAAGVAGTQLLAQREDEAEEIVALEVAEEDVFDLESCAEVDSQDAFELFGDYELPFGSLVWADDEEVAACLLPTEQASPLVNVVALSLSTGNYFTVLEQAIGAEEGFEVYDVRATSAGFVWTEAAIMEGLWRVYTATLSDYTLGEAHLVDEGNGSTEVPTLAAVGDYAFWQTCAPITNENARHEPALVKCATFASGEARTIYESVGRLSAPIAPYEDSVVITPRHEGAVSYCDLVRLDAKSGRVTERITLPSGMMPNQVGFGATGFAFCFESIYDYGGGISNLGTYTPAAAPRAGSYEGLSWFRFNRTPTAAPCWCTDTWFMVKSNQSVCAVNLENRVFCSLGVESGCQDWGDYLASSGKHNNVVSVMQINQVDNDNVETKKTQVRVWRPLASVPEGTVEEANSEDAAPQEAGSETADTEEDASNTTE